MSGRLREPPRPDPPLRKVRERTGHPRGHEVDLTQANRRLEWPTISSVKRPLVVLLNVQLRDHSGVVRWPEAFRRLACLGRAE
jgi:hypothetical protein